MSLSFNGTEPQSITWNGADVQSVTYNGVEVWSAHPPFLVRMRYDANEASHVKDLVGGYTITISDGSAVSAAVDPFGGTNALNLEGPNKFVKYGGNKAIDRNKMTVCCWVKQIGKNTNTFVSRATGANPMFNVDFWDGKMGCLTDQIGGSGKIMSSEAANLNTWHYWELSIDNGIVRIFLDGVLKTTATNNTLQTVHALKVEGEEMWIGNFPYNSGANYFNGHIYDLCILNGVWHTENYNVPTAYI